MTTTQLIESLSASGIQLSVTDGRLKIDAPAGVLTVEMKTEMAVHKPELLRLISSALCKICKAQLLTDEPRHFWCPAGHYDSWLPNPIRQPESVNFCVNCGLWLDDDGSCLTCRVPFINANFLLRCAN